MRDRVIEIRRIDSKLESALIELYNVITSSGEGRFFHPHPFDTATATKIAHYTGKDLYYAVVDDARIIGYGMLRGWDEGYEIPSLGIIIHPEMRGMKLGNMLMHFLHTIALIRGAKKVRLKVYPANIAAVRMYEKLGYGFQHDVSGQVVGILNIS